jgi:hypothetical protein
MNNNRLSTSIPKINSTPLITEIEEFLKQPSNYEIRDGKLFILSLNRFRVYNSAVSILLVDANTDETIKSFLSLAECARYLGIARSTVNNRALKGKSFLLPATVECKGASKEKDRLVYLRLLTAD